VNQELLVAMLLQVFSQIPPFSRTWLGIFTGTGDVGVSERLFTYLRKGNIPRECAETSAYPKGMALTRGLLGFLQLFLLLHYDICKHFIDIRFDVILFASECEG